MITVPFHRCTIRAPGTTPAAGITPSQQGLKIDVSISGSNVALIIHFPIDRREVIVRCQQAFVKPSLSIWEAGKYYRTVMPH
ncbi:hypothetical protein FA13DRAFT_1733042 [Coprinellus micaceus]|uniref:Uncharacterized protein n=1 Tax=Coprinellus micaceus TaxID=71717 RepID=A0A4Y7TA79_COPMI|nr:hypothetical protein FA13DRAFT_1733042 [Coprinellus micaceus]